MRRWRITWGPLSWCADDLLAADLVLICAGVGSDTWALSPELGPVHLVANIAARLSVVGGVEFGNALISVQSVSAAALLDALSWEEVPS